MSVGCLYVHPILLGLKLLQEFAVIVLLSMVLLLIFWLWPIAIHALSSTVISSLVTLPWLLLLCTRIKILNSDIFLLYMSALIGWVKYIDSFMNVLLLFILIDFTNIQLVHSQILLMLQFWLLLRGTLNISPFWWRVILVSRHLNAPCLTL